MESVTLGAEQISLLNRLLTTMRHDVANCLAIIMGGGELIRMGTKEVGTWTGRVFEKQLKSSELLGAFRHDFEWMFGLTREGMAPPQPCLSESVFFASCEPLVLFDGSEGHTCPKCGCPVDHMAPGAPPQVQSRRGGFRAEETATCRCVALRKAPVTLTGEQIQGLHGRLVAMCAEVNGSLARIAEAAAHVRGNPGLNHEADGTIIVEQSPNIQEPIRAYSDQFELMLGILHPASREFRMPSR
jgi:hypothetical protein